MDETKKELGSSLVQLRKQNPAWQMVASRRAPLILACLKALFETNHTVPVETLEESLAELLEEHANDETFAIGTDYLLEARREWRNWIKRRLIVERDGRLTATDDLQRILLFVDGIQDRIMTSTASRLGTVQREIANLAIRLNPDASVREQNLESQIAQLQQELAAAKRGEYEVLQGDSATEGIREVYDLAMSLRADFRRVEDSYRDADRELRQEIISDGHHRGEVVDSLLDSHDELIRTPEGQVFSGFHQQLTEQVELTRMKQGLKEIVSVAGDSKALNRQQLTELTLLTMGLVKESQGVIKARARSERDVKGFIKTGLAGEHHRVGQLLGELMDTALNVNWQSQQIRRQPAPLPCIGLSLGNLPLVQRLRIHATGQDEDAPLQLLPQTASLDEIGNEFWSTFDTLDKERLYHRTLQLLTGHDTGLRLSELATALATHHDLESIAFWLALARDLDLPFADTTETFDLITDDGTTLTYTLPDIQLTAGAMRQANWENA